MCICDKYGYRTRLHKDTLEHYCPVCLYRYHEPIIQPTLEQIVGKEKAAKIRAVRTKPLEVRYYAING